jgi:hypothetical protein
MTANDDNKPSVEFQKFDETVRKMLSVPRDELEKREKAWKRKREKKKRAKS